MMLDVFEHKTEKSKCVLTDGATYAIIPLSAITQRTAMLRAAAKFDPADPTNIEEPTGLIGKHVITLNRRET
jgi:hypothetical protein